MPLTDMLKTLGIDTTNQSEVVRLIKGLNLSDKQKTDMYYQYIQEIYSPADPAARTAADFLPQ